MKTLRKPESETIYQEYLKTKPVGCPFCLEVDDGKLWRIQPARFPYDAVYEQHDLLIPVRHISSINELNLQEKDQLMQIFQDFNNSNIYSSISLNFRHKQTVPSHLHFHLLKLEN